MQYTEQLIHNLCTQGFHFIDEFLSLDQYLGLRDLAQAQYQQGLFRGAKIGLTVNSKPNHAIRTDEILWLEEQDQNPSVQFFLKHINQLAALLNQNLFLGLHEFETHFASYQPGTYYKKHIDQFAAQKTRKISFVYYLNSDWQQEYGGELKLYDKHHQLIQKVLPQGNRFICFNSELPHEVALTHQVRYSITGWMKTRPSDIL